MTTTKTPVSFRPRELVVAEDGTGHLVGSRCPTCGAHYFPTREVCAGCLTEDLETVPLPRRGTLYTYTAVHQSTPAFETPYVLGYVDLEAPVRVMGQIDVDPEEVAIGMALELKIVPWGTDDEGRTVWGYRFGGVS